MFVLKLTEISREGLTNWKLDFLNIWDILKTPFLLSRNWEKHDFTDRWKKYFFDTFKKKPNLKKHSEVKFVRESRYKNVGLDLPTYDVTRGKKKWRHALFKNDVTHGLRNDTHAAVLWGAPKNVFVTPPCVTWCSLFIGRSQELESLGLHGPPYFFKTRDG